MIMHLILLDAVTYIRQNLILPSPFILGMVFKFLYVFHISYIVFYQAYYNYKYLVKMKNMTLKETPSRVYRGPYIAMNIAIV